MNSSVAARTGKGRPAGMSFFNDPVSVFTFAASTTSPADLSFTQLARSAFNCSIELGDSGDQKYRNTQRPRRDCNCQILLLTSGKEKSGATSGSMSQVSEDSGSCSVGSPMSGRASAQRDSL